MKLPAPIVKPNNRPGTNPDAFFVALIIFIIAAFLISGLSGCNRQHFLFSPAPPLRVHDKLDCYDTLVMDSDGLSSGYVTQEQYDSFQKQYSTYKIKLVPFEDYGFPDTVKLSNDLEAISGLQFDSIHIKGSPYYLILRTKAHNIYPDSMWLYIDKKYIQQEADTLKFIH